MKPYDVGLICGRFQTFHKGHEKLVETGLMLCDRLLIFVGSSQECGTERNPLNINTRTKMIKAVYGDNDNIMIYGLADLTNENDIRPEWGRYLLDNADRYIHKNPEVMIYGNDESRSAWFDKSDLKNTTELIINRAELPVSGTMLREFMFADKRKEWMQWVNPKLHKMYDEIRSELLASKQKAQERTKIKNALRCLNDNGIDKMECPEVLRALCYILYDAEIDNLLEEDDYSD